MPDRAALVTGASRGIGLALAEALGEAGFGLTLVARKPDTLEQTADRLREQGFEVEFLAGNMNDEEAIREASSKRCTTIATADWTFWSTAPGCASAPMPQST